MSITRRTFSRIVGLGLVGAALPAAAQRKLNVKVGHTGITWPWGNAPRGGPAGLTGPDPIIEVVRDVSSLGFQGLELFGWQIEGMEKFGGLGPVLEKHKLPLVSSYTGVNLTDPAQRQATIAAAVTTGKLVKKLGGTVMVIGPNGVPRNTFDFAANKANIVTRAQRGGPGPDRSRSHARSCTSTPGTCIETRDETYAVMEAVDTRVHEVRARHRPAAEGRRRPGAGREGLPAARPSHAPEGLQRRRGVPRLLPARSRARSTCRRSWR